MLNYSRVSYLFLGVYRVSYEVLMEKLIDIYVFFTPQVRTVKEPEIIKPLLTPWCFLYVSRADGVTPGV